MKRVPVDTKAQILRAICDHVQVHGRASWSLVREKFPEYLVGPEGSAEEKRFFRLAREAQDFGAAPAEARAEALKKARGSTKRNVPQPPSPATFLATGADAQRGIDIMEMLHITLRDIMLVRQMAMKVTEDGAEAVKNPQLMDSSIKRRLDIVNTFLAVFREVYDLQQMRGFYDEIVSIIIEEIHPLDPAVSERILLRLKELNDREGMTIHASA